MQAKSFEADVAFANFLPKEYFSFKPQLPDRWSTGVEKCHSEKAVLVGSLFVAFTTSRVSLTSTTSRKLTKKNKQVTDYLTLSMKKRKIWQPRQKQLQLTTPKFKALNSSADFVLFCLICCLYNYTELTAPAPSFQRQWYQIWHKNRFLNQEHSALICSPWY